MKTPHGKRVRKPGANGNETAAQPHKHGANFRQSRDELDDRRERQIKLGTAKNSRRTKQPGGS